MSFAPRNDYTPRRQPPRRRRRRRTPFIIKLLAFIGAATLFVLLGRFLIVPLLVYLNTLGGVV